MILKFSISVVWIILLCSFSVMATNDVSFLLKDHHSNVYMGSLDNVKKKRFLRVLTTKNSINYFIHKSEERGYEFEMVKSFVSYMNKKEGFSEKDLPIRFEMIPVRRDELIPMLEKGYGDMIAAGLTDTPSRRKTLLFSDPFRKVEEVLIVSSKIKSIKDWKGLSGHKIAVRESSSYFESLKKVNVFLKNNNIPEVDIIRVDESLETLDLIELVSLGKYTMTLADSHIAKVAVSIFDGISYIDGLNFRSNGRISWALPKKSKGMKRMIDGFLPSYKQGSFLGNITTKKYFKNIDKIKLGRNLESNKEISKHDLLIKKYADKFNFDWVLLSSQAYQESGLKQDVVNKWGAIGIFQIKQQTADEPYININNISGKKYTENNIHAGVKYMHWIKSRYFDKNVRMKEKDRIRFALAAYNAGPNRILKARGLAKKMGFDSDKWFRNVEYVLLSQGKLEPVKYVSDINKRFVAYSLLLNINKK
jgi:membrane-bound lytic murein transglycosylase MltF